MAKGKNKGTFHVLGPPPEEEARRKLLLEVFCSFLGPEEAAQQLDLLLNRFGSFKSILTAPEEELVLAGASDKRHAFSANPRNWREHIWRRTPNLSNEFSTRNRPAR